MGILLYQLDLEQEMSRLRQELLERKDHMVAADLDQDMVKLRQEVEKLRQDLEDSRTREQQLSSPKIPSPALEKLKVSIRNG
jgi:hypothetical protein